MVDPLVGHSERLVGGEIYRQAVLRKYGKTVFGNHFRDTVVYFGVYVIRASCKDYSEPVVFLHPFKGLPALFTDVRFSSVLLLPCLVNRVPDLMLGDVPFLSAELYKPVSRDFFGGEGYERSYVSYLAVGNLLDIVFEVFRV